MTRRILLYATVSWPSAARYASGFVTAGYEATALAPKRAPVMASRYLSRGFAHRPLRPLSSLRRTIAAAEPDFIVSCDDRAVANLLALHAKEAPGSAIAELVERSLGEPTRYRRMLSRYDSLTAMRAAGVSIPDTLAITSRDDLDAGLAQLGLPVVLKSDGSWGGGGVAIVRTKEDAVAAWRRLSSPPSRLRSLARAARRKDLHFINDALLPPRPAVSMQRFIPGKPAASAFAAYKGRIAGHFHYDVIKAEGEIGPPNVIRRVDDPAMDEAVRAVAATFGLSGLHGLDFIRDANGNVHLIEINPRATQGGTLPFGAGRDLPAALVAAVEERSVELRPAIENDLVVFFPREWRHDAASPYLKTGHHDVPWDDPAILVAALAG